MENGYPHLDTQFSGEWPSHAHTRTWAGVFSGLELGLGCSAGQELRVQISQIVLYSFKKLCIIFVLILHVNPLMACVDMIVDFTKVSCLCTDCVFDLTEGPISVLIVYFTSPKVLSLY